MTPEIVQFLISEAAREALADLAANPALLSDTSTLATLSKLRKQFSPEQAAGLLEIATSRLKAEQQHKFTHASKLFFSRTALEQSSSETIAAYRAQRFAKVLPPGNSVADLGCACGGDSLALAKYFHVTGIDLDEARLCFARANSIACNVYANFTPIKADIAEFDVSNYAALFFDPARRTADGKRIFSVEDYSPPLSIVQNWLNQVEGIAVKISPGVNYAELASYDCEVEIISENGDVKEAVLWFGKLRTPTITRRATLLPAGHTLTEQPDHAPVEITEPQAYLYEPDGAVIRAGLVEELALTLGATKLDADIAYLTAPELVSTPFARSFRVLETLPFNLKKLQVRLSALQAGRVTIKKRGSPLEPQELEKLLKLKKTQPNEFILVLTHIKGVHSVIICEGKPAN